MGQQDLNFPLRPTILFTLSSRGDKIEVFERVKRLLEEVEGVDKPWRARKRG